MHLARQILVGLVAVLAAGGIATATAAAATFGPSADAYVASNAAKTNFGSATELRAGSVPDTRSYARFDVQGVVGTVDRAVLWLWVKNASSTGFDVRAVGRSNWSESTITYKGAPNLGALAGASGPVTFSTWAAVDVTALVPGNGGVSLAVTSASPSTLAFASREAGAALAPRLEVTVRDTIAPSVSLTSPASGSATSDTTPAFAGLAGTAEGDDTALAVKVYAGAAATGSPLQTLAAQVAPDGAFSVAPGSPLPEGTTTAQAEQNDQAGNIGRSAAVTFSVDATAPAASITSAPTDPSGSASAGFSFGANEAATFECRLDGAAFTACASPKTYAGLADGTHTFALRATDAAGNTGPVASRSWRVDTTAPATSITSGPADPSGDAGASLSFGASEAATFECRLDGGAYAACTSPKTYAALADGAHDFAVRATDAAGNTGAAATTSWRVDTAAPAVTLDQPAEGSTTNDTTPTLAGTAGTAAGDQPTVTVDVFAAGTPNTPVASPTATVSGDGSFAVSPGSALADGSYTAKARQSDSLGHVGTSAVRSFIVDRSATDVDPPVISVSSPQAGSSVGSATPAIAGTAGTADGDLATVTIKLYAGASATGAPEQTLTTQRQAGGSFSAVPSALSGGQHTVRAEQRDTLGNTGYSAPTTFVVDTTAPAVTLTQPVNASKTADRRPTFAGAAGAAPGDAATVTVGVYPGATATGTPTQSLSATRQTDGTYAVQASSALAEGTYTARATQSDAAGNVGTSTASTFVVRDPVLVGAGDIASCEGSDGDDETAALLDARPDAIVYTLGDNAYTDGTAAQYSNCYDPTWGRSKARTRPAVGGHDYGDGANAGAGHYGYFQSQLAPFGASASDPARGYYSYDLGSWHVTVLNAFCYTQTTCNELVMEQWFADDLAAHPASCSLVMWHNARFSSGSIHGNSVAMQTLWATAYEAGVDVVLSGHEHTYERFAPQDATGASDPAHGVRQFLVGTGGYYHYALGAARKPNSEVFNSDTYGVLQLGLHPGSYDWEFVPEAGKTFRDSGTGQCHDAPPGPPPPPAGAPTVQGTASATANGPATQLSIPRPAQASTGSLLVAMVANQGGSVKTMSPPAGWTAVANSDFYEGTNARIRAWYRFATANESASYTFTQSGTSGYDMAGGIVAVSNANPQAPVNASGGQSNGSTGSKTVTAPSITPTVPGTLLLFGGACNVAASFLPPTGMTELWDVASSGQYKISAETAWQYLAAGGPTGTRSATASTSCRSVANQVAVAPAGG